MSKMPFFVRGDVDGLFGLFIDNLLQLMLINVFCRAFCGFDQQLVTGRILPAAALSILVGNLFYTWEARKLMRREQRLDVTALPYGINTPSLIAYVFIVMAPVYQQTRDANLAWQAGLVACIGSGIIECAGAFVGDWLRRNTPRAALLAALGGIAITFIAMGFIFQIFASPLIAIVPMFLIIIAYASKVRLPFGLPGGLLAVLLGVGLAWLLKLLGLPTFTPAADAYEFGLYLPIPAFPELVAGLTGPDSWKYFFIIVFPMGLFNAIGSLQNLESAAAAGDHYPTRPAMLANGLGTVVAAVFGSPFPTTIYIGHPSWKAMGARAGYSALNGLLISLCCMLGAVTLILRFVPLEATLGILLWIGLIIAAQCFQEVPRQHAPAVVVGFIPSLAAWLLVVIETSLRAGGSSLAQAMAGFKRENFFIEGVIALSQGFLLTSMCLAAIVVFIVEGRFLTAACWMMLTALLALFGIIHAYTMTDHGVANHFGLGAGWPWGLAYAMVALLLFGLHFWQEGGRHVQSR